MVVCPSICGFNFILLQTHSGARARTRGWSGSVAFKDDSPKRTDQGTRTALPKAPSTLIPPMAQRPSNNCLTDRTCF